jgi:hypothetical protein
VRTPSQLKEWVTFVLGLLDIHNAWYARLALDAEGLDKNFLTWRSQYHEAADPRQGAESASGVGVRLEQGIPGVYWGNYFGPFYVNWFGRQKMEDLPAVEKCWLDTGGLFFTTADSPFSWNAPQARELQSAVKDHLGRDAFFDIEAVKASLRKLEPIPEHMEPEQLQSRRRVPDFPFEIRLPEPRSTQEAIAEAKQYFESRGFTFMEMLSDETLLFQDEKGGITKVTVGPQGSVDYYPNQ